MHMSDYGWYKVDRFMIDTYHLSKWNIQPPNVFL
jgi:hypothetical protein